MNTIAFFDIETEPNSGKILDIGSVTGNGSTFHSTSLAVFIRFLHGSEYVCGHNIFNHDLKYIHDAINAAGISNNFIEERCPSVITYKKDSNSNSVFKSTMSRDGFTPSNREFCTMPVPCKEISWLANQIFEHWVSFCYVEWLKLFYIKTLENQQFVKKGI